MTLPATCARLVRAAHATTAAAAAAGFATTVAVTVVTAMAAPPPAAAQELDVAGLVIDQESGDPVADMSVVVRSEDGSRFWRSVTDERGRFHVTVSSAGTYLVALTRIGYEGVATTRVEVRPGQDLWLELRVQPTAIELEPIGVSVKARNPYLESEGFYRRMAENNGVHWEREDIEAYPSDWPRHVLRRIGISFTPDGVIRGCRLLVDGMDLTDWELPVDDLIAKDQMAAIEVYGMPVPVELRGPTLGNGCVVAIWTTWGEKVVRGGR